MRWKRNERVSWIAALGAAMLAGAVYADVPAPDNILYGTIQLADGTPLAAGDTAYSVEARRTTDSQLVASYQMGAQPEAGNFYLLRIPLEEVAPAAGESASLVSTEFSINLLHNDQQVTQQVYVAAARGVAARVDFGLPLDDADGNGIGDVYELVVLGGVDQDPDADPDGDGASDGDEYVAGTNPRGGAGSGVSRQDDTFLLDIKATNGEHRVSFFAHRAEGVGYGGKTRHYALMDSTNSALPWLWFGVPGVSDITGNAQYVTYDPPGEGKSTLYRGRVWLTMP